MERDFGITEPMGIPETPVLERGPEIDPAESGLVGLDPAESAH